MKQILRYGFLASMLFFFNSVLAQNSDWTKKENFTNSQTVSKFNLSPQKVHFFELNVNAFKERLATAPLRGNTFGSSTVVKVPGIDGRLESFKMYEASVFAPELAADFPNIKSYVGFSQENQGAQLRMSISHKGVQTMISYVDKSTVFMQPADDAISTYVLYTRDARVSTIGEFNCSTIAEVQDRFTDPQPEDADDQILRKFRIAISVTGEYTAYHGGAVADAMAAINTTMTRVNAIFEVDMSVTFEVIANNQTVIFTNANTDPYSPSGSGLDDHPVYGGSPWFATNWNVELQETLRDDIGEANYDIGHLFGAAGGGGNAGCIGCVCDTDFPQGKGSGYTSPADGIPEGDTFDVDYVAHEIGHQMGANHTWAFNIEGTGVNAEPGSGSTIMGYAGITGANNVQQNSDPYFHYHSIKQVTDNLVTQTCWNANNSPMLANNPPNASAGNDYIIPQGTAYVLRGTATDADGGDALTYCWEQTDSGQVRNSTFGPTLTAGSMNRSQVPTSSPNRYIPKLSRVASGNITQTNPTINSAWETVATVNRTMNWALTVRDRQPTATGLDGQSSFDLMEITVTTSAGPFVVNSQTSNVSWEMGTSQTVTWNVANTDAAPVSTANVNILLSTDGGATFPTILASNVPNDGSQTITVPVTTPTSQARIIVEGAGNIFFAMNSSDFTLVEPDFALVFADNDETACQPANAVYNFTYNAFNGFSGTTNFSTVNLPAGAMATFSPTSASVDGTNVMLTISGTTGVASGSYTFSAQGTSGATTRASDVLLSVFPGSLTPVTLTSPSNGATNVAVNANLSWSANSNAANYVIEIASDMAFTNIVESATITTTNYTATTLNLSNTYYWRVGVSNDCVATVYSTVYSFATQTCAVCASVANTDFATSTTLVLFADINNVTAKPSGYTDYSTTDFTDVTKESSYPITVNANTDGDYRTQTKVWIDWNQNCSFDDSGEEYDLGEADNVPNGATANSGMMIMVPSAALTGSTTMRVSTKYTSRATVVFPTSCENGADAEVEDYRINVQNTLSTVENELEDFAIWPNPTRGKFTVNFTSTSSEKVTIDVLDIRGRAIFSKKYTNSANFIEELNISSAAAGMYMVRVNDGERVSIKKLIVQ
ncbi:T9SS type A sorting domain-containing protein [Kordia sp. YSTF-M3]|uniref:T9SS type A sorting domain-containing protein n=1 Tax=Kordia aestuariivivens TaxID=2759037 RepID=A0ABR7Q7I7_9FLAO|nr:zinc-dependent metalloprotease [Kordia aestuariivivens]MBC8754492.1 T9SS type A sorting domain-containing protein [Kordia aestuariivivens]